MDDLFLPVSDPPLTLPPPPPTPPLQCCYSLLGVSTQHPSIQVLSYGAAPLSEVSWGCNFWHPCYAREMTNCFVGFKPQNISPPPPQQHTSPSLLPHTILLSLLWAQWLTELETAIWGHASAVTIPFVTCVPSGLCLFVSLLLHLGLFCCNFLGGVGGVGVGDCGVGGCGGAMQGCREWHVSWLMQDPQVLHQFT